MNELMYLLPIGVVFAAALVVVLLDTVLPRTERYLLPWVALTGCAVALVSTYQIHQTLADQGIWFLSSAGPADARLIGPVMVRGSFCLDGFGMAIWVLACLAGALSILAASPATEESALSSGEYYGLTLLAVAGMMLLGTAHDWLTLIISLEIMSVATYILAGSRRDDIRSNEAALKYLLLGAFSTAFLLMGIAFYYGAFGSLSLTPNPAVLRLPLHELQSRHSFALLGLGLVLVGALFKIGATPFHFWVPDVYEGAPTAVTGLMAAGVKAAAFAVLARLAFETFGGHEYRTAWLPLLLVASLLTMIVGNVLAIRQSSVKRMLAYSSIAHTGYLLLAFLVLPHPKDVGAINANLEAVVFYLLVYSVMTVGAFGVVALVREDGRPLETMDDYAGLAKEHPGIALCMAIFMLSLAGVPPTGGFFAKFLVFRGAIGQGVLEQGQHQTAILFAAVVGILMSVVSLYYYLRVIVKMYMSPANDTAAPAPAARCRYAWGLTVLIYAAGVVTLLSGFLPGWFY
ncbi:MAG: NADH-quinone oxidoreductase subunit N [Planctomycetota bacterium]|nr:NADH-quinone oxidoreductase subunit N [Planctomycetota bacterium]